MERRGNTNIRAAVDGSLDAILLTSSLQLADKFPPDTFPHLLSGLIASGMVGFVLWHWRQFYLTDKKS